MNLQIVTGRAGRVFHVDLKQPRTVLIAAASVMLLVGAVFTAGLELGRIVAGPLDRAAVDRELDLQRASVADIRSEMQGKVNALASRIGTLNAHLIRLDAMGRRVTDLAGLDRGEFDFDQPPPAGGPDGGEFPGGSMQVPDLTVALDALEAQLIDLGERVLPGGWPIIGGWISSHFGYRTDPIHGRGAFHAGVDFAAPPGSKVIATGPGVVTFSGYKQG